MTFPSLSTPASRYQAYRKPEYQYTPEGCLIPHAEGKVRDHDGAPLYETEWSSLRTEIIENNDVPLLRQYLDVFPNACGPGYVSHYDPFHVAASCGSTDALRMMLQHWAADPSQVVPAPDERESSLLYVACLGGQVETVRFLVDESLPWAARFGKISDFSENEDGTFLGSSLMAAARPYATRPRGGKVWRKSEELMCLLLDMGASARDADSRPALGDPPSAVLGPQFKDTVLSLAIAGASANMVRRLVGGGADIHAKVHVSSCDGMFGGREDQAWDVTVLHIGSFHFNVQGIKALFESPGESSEFSLSDMVSCRDDRGRIPLHWAAGSEYPEKFDLKACNGNDDIIEDITSQAISTIKLLLAGNIDTINARDASGHTPLHYAVRNYCGRCPWHYLIIKVLCKSGADARVRDSKGKTVLHLLFSHHDEPQPDDAALIVLLVGCGINVYDVDGCGRTAVHLAADRLRDIEAVRILLVQAGSRANEVLCAAGAQGNTPLHVAATGHVYAVGASTDDQIRAQVEMMRALLPSGDGNTDEPSLMDRRNRVGKTPRQLCKKTREKWRQDVEDEKARAADMAMGRGRGRGQVRGRVTVW